MEVGRSVSRDSTDKEVKPEGRIFEPQSQSYYVCAHKKVTHATCTMNAHSFTTCSYLSNTGGQVRYKLTDQQL